jgi:hypothetical protein
MDDVKVAPKTVKDIIEAAGGPKVVAEACGPSVSVDAVYKWPRIGIPDRHWPHILPLAGASAAEMLAANIAARAA